MLFILIALGRLDFSGDSAVKSFAGTELQNLRLSDPDLLCFAAVPSLQDLALIMTPLLIVISCAVVILAL